MAAAAARAALGNLLSDLGWNARYQDADVRHTRQATFSNPPSAGIIHNHLHHCTLPGQTHNYTQAKGGR